MARYKLDGTFVGKAEGARDSHLERAVLIKRWWSARERASIRDLVSLISELQNKHISDVYDLLEHHENLAVIEERLEGNDLKSWASTDVRRPDEVLRVLFQMFEAVAGMESAGLSPPSLDLKHWRFDGEGLLNLSVFIRVNDQPRTPQPVTPSKTAEHLQRLSEFAAALARHLAEASAAPDLFSDPVIGGLLQGSPSTAHTISECVERLRAWVLRDQHRAMVVYRHRSSELNAKRRTLKLVHPISDIAEATITYNGLWFYLTPVKEVYINNVHATARIPMPSSCIVTLGAPTRNWSERHFITFDASQPEVVF